MIELILVVLVCCLCSSWLVPVLGFILAILLAIMQMNASFVLHLNHFYWGSSITNLLVFLTCLLCFLSFIATPEEKGSHSYSICLSALCVVLVLAFASSNLISFYIFFEASLIPTLILIVGWGYQPERLQAATYMMLYTVGASLPLLLFILYHGESMTTLDMFSLHEMSPMLTGIIAVVVYGAFLVKLPMYGAHLWLPKAHVEAPLAGSMILAGILLKLGGYGLIQVNYCFNMTLSAPLIAIVSLSMWGGFLATLMCLRQVDVKALVAYSSVGHMSIVAAGILVDTSWGIVSSVITMVAHGFSSSAMFCLAYFTYKKSHTRNIPYMKGMLQVYPVLSMFWFLFCCINMACPPTLNLMGEMAIVPTLWSFNFWLALIMGLMVFLSAAYNMYLYASVNHGSFSSYFLSGSPMKSYCMAVLFAHLFPLILIFKSSLFTLYLFSF